MLSISTNEFRRLPVAAIRANGYNPNRMSPGQFEALKRTIQKDGFVGVALVNQTSEGYIIIDGEHRWRAAQELGLTDMPCAVIRVPDDQAKALTIKLNQIHGDWLPDLLADLVSGLPEPTPDLGFAEGELEQLLLQFHEAQALEPFGATRGHEGSRRCRAQSVERYIGFNLSPERARLLEQALETATPANQDRRNPRAGCLEVILQSYLALRSPETARE